MFSNRAPKVTLRLAGKKPFVSERIVLLMIGRDTHFIEKNEGFYFKQESRRTTWTGNKETKSWAKPM